MSGLELISEYFSDDMTRRATVTMELATKRFRVTTVSKTGYASSSMFDVEDEAEEFAEEWVKPL